MFGVLWISITAAIWLRTRSMAALVALPALCGTVALWWVPADNAAAYSSAIWPLAGLLLIYQGLKSGSIPRNSEYVAGALYGMSGLVYILFYLGASSETLAIVPIISDVAFCLGLIAGTWPNALAGLLGGNRRSFRRTAVQIARADLAGDSMRDRIK